MEENLKKNTYMCIYRYTHKYNWITLLFTWNIVNQLDFNWQKRNHHHHQQKKRVWWDFLCGFVWGAVLPCLYLQPCFPAQDRNPHWRHILEAIPPALRTVSHALVYSPLLEILSWRDRRPRWLLGGILQGATLGAVTVMFISGEADIRIRERPHPFCWLGFRFLAPGAFWGLATSLVFCEMSWTHQSVTPVSLKEVQIGMLFAVKERWWSRLFQFGLLLCQALCWVCLMCQTYMDSKVLFTSLWKSQRASAELRTEVGLSGGRGRVFRMDGAVGAEVQTQGVEWSQQCGAFGLLWRWWGLTGRWEQGSESFTLWTLPWGPGVTSRLLVWRRSLCFVLLVQIFLDVQLPRFKSQMLSLKNLDI